MRLLAIDASETEPTALLRLLDAHRVDRRLVLGGAALGLARWAETERARSDGAYLDRVAHYVLGRARESDVPSRGAFPAALDQLIAVGANPEGLAPLEATDRAVEMQGSIIAMAVPDRRRWLESEEDLGNATFWIAGGSAMPQLSRERDVPVLSPGHLGPDGGGLLVDVDRRSVRARVLNIDGERVAQETFDLTARPRLSVQGG